MSKYKRNLKFILKYELSFDRMYILLNGEDAKAVCRQLKTVFGIHSFSLCYQVKSDLESIKEACLHVIENNPGNTFKIDTKRNDKEFPMQSHDINTAIAGHTKIGQKTFIGVGTAIIDDIVVGKEVIIGAGSSVISNIPEYTTVVGVPAKVIKVHKNHK